MVKTDGCFCRFSDNGVFIAEYLLLCGAHLNEMGVRKIVPVLAWQISVITTRLSRRGNHAV